MAVRVSVEFSGLVLMVRRWPRGMSWAEANEGVLSRTVEMYGVRSSHHPHAATLMVPAGSIDWANGSTADRIVTTPTGQYAVWALDGHELHLTTESTSEGVQFRDRLRPKDDMSPRYPTPGDWDDVAWIADLERVLGRAVNLVDEPREKSVFIATLTAGTLFARRPHAPKDANATFSFDPNVNPGYSQSFSDRVVNTVTGESPMIRLSRDGTDVDIRLKLDAECFVAMLPLAGGGDADRLNHFAHLYDLIAEAPTPRPIPVRNPSPSGDLRPMLIDPVFCLMGMINQAE
jgi:hypothetical protein